MLNRLDRYLLREVTVTFVAVTGVLLIVLLSNQFARVLESLEDLGRHLERTRAAYDQTLERFARGRGNLVSRVTQLEKLGAKARKALPGTILAVADLDEDETEAQADG